jgi:hypothetical protein
VNEHSLLGDDKQVVAWRDAGQGGDKTLAVHLHRLQLTTHPDHRNVSPPLLRVLSRFRTEYRQGFVARGRS